MKSEIDENLIRHNLTALEEGEQLIERDELLAARGERSQVGQGRPSNDAKNGETVSPLKTTAGIAAQAGLSERTAQHRKQAARKPMTRPAAAAIQKYDPLPRRPANGVGNSREAFSEARGLLKIQNVFMFAGGLTRTANVA
jgi:hypothetical protein